MFIASIVEKKPIHYKNAFPNVSFPSNGPSDEFLSEHGYTKVCIWKDHNQSTQKLVSVDPYLENGYVYTVNVENKTQDELDADRNSLAAKVRKQRDDLLSKTDWRVIKSVETGISLDSSWATYRQSLRDISTQENFPSNVTWPEEPSES